MLTDKQAREAVEQYREEGYAVVRQFVDGDEMIRLKKETDAVYAEGLKHHATYRHGNLNFQILPESDFGQRYVLQAYWCAGSLISPSSRCCSKAGRSMPTPPNTC